MAEAQQLKEEGNAKFKAGQFAAAVDAYTRALELEPTLHLCLSNRSAAYLKLGGAAEQALADAAKCVELDPKFAKGYSRQAAALQELKRWEDAIKICEQGLAATQDEALRKMLVEVRCRHFQDKIQGAWHGTVSKDLGGYDQEMEFLDHGKVRVDALGRSILGSFWLDCEEKPHHLNIQVPMPDAPPGMPPPPPVPYIVSHDEKGLHLCCPFMVPDRPTSFDGPGYCLMVRGAANSDEMAELISKMSEDEKLQACVKELIGALPDSKLDEPKESDPEEVIREKLMLQVRFESGMFAVEKKFGKETMQQVLHEANADSAGKSGTADMKKLKEKLRVCGLLDEVSAMPAPSVGPSPAQAPVEKEKVEPGRPKAAKPAGASAEPLQQDKVSGAPAGDGSLVIVAGLTLAAAAIVGGFLLYKRRRS